MPARTGRFTRSGGIRPNIQAPGDVLRSVMRSLSALALSLLLASCSAPESEPTEAAPEAWDSPSDQGPVLIGTVRSPDGAPLANVQVRTHGGLATRWVLQTTRTDAEGRFRFDPVQGQPLGTTFGEAPQLMIGLCVGSVRNANPPEYLPWRDLTVTNRPGIVERADFSFDPDSVPLEHRDG